MSKMLEANCAIGIVTTGGVPVASADILSEGVGPSSGVLLLDEGQAKYITSNASDLKTAIDKIASAITEIANTFTAVAASMIGPATAPPPTLPVSVGLLMAKVAELQILKETLK